MTTVGSESQGTVSADSGSQDHARFEKVVSIVHNQLTTRKLKGVDNYPLWKNAITMALKGRALAGHLTDEPPSETTQEGKAWHMSDANLVNLLWDSMETKVSDLVSHCSSVKQMWDYLSMLYSGQSNASRIYDVSQAWSRFTMGNRSVTELFADFSKLDEELNALMPVTNKVEDMLKQQRLLSMMTFLGALRPEFNAVKSQILGDTSVVSISDAYARLLRMTCDEPRSSSVSDTIRSDNSAMLTQNFVHSGGGRGRGRVPTYRGGFQGSEGRSSRPRPICHHCGVEGHIMAKCWKLHGKPPIHKVHASVADHVEGLPISRDDRGIIISKDDYEKFIQSQISTGTHTSAIAMTSPSTGTPTAFVSTTTPRTWVIDSGASAHMTGDAGILNSICPVNTFSTVKLADGSQSIITGIGNSSLLPTLSLDSVLHVPRFPLSLLSVSQLTKKLDCTITFSSSSCTLQDRQTRRIFGSGTESGGLYYFDNNPISTSFTVTTPSLHQLHYQLGHPSLPRLQHLYPQFRHVSRLECESCEMGKHRRVSYAPRVNNRVKAPFDLVHSDIWGPCPIISRRGFKYFVTFIDDFSRCTWLYLLKSRSDLFSVFTLFVAEIQTHFGRTIKFLRSDNAPEYKTCTQIQSFMASHGILHHTSCSYTPQQNGVAERKNRHLLEVSRAMRFHMNVPKCFWDDAVLTACFLINRMPSIVLANNTPFYMLYPDKTPFSLSPKIFGSTCFVHNFGPGRDKLDPRSTKCIFLGYSRSQKGYKCYSPILKRDFVSKDVTFFESTPYYPSKISDVEIDPCDHDEPSSITISVTDSQHPLVPAPVPLNSESTDNPPIVYTYQRRQRTLPNLESVALPSDSDSYPLPTLMDGPDLTLDLPIALRKGTRACTKYPIANYISDNSLSSSFQAFLTSISSHIVPKSHKEALLIPEWQDAMMEELQALETNGTWSLVPLPKGRSVVGCRWVFAIKTHPDGSIARYKARLVAKGFSQTYGVDYTETFSPVAKMSSIRLLISLAVTHSWPLSQLDVPNAFLHGDLNEEIYMEQPPGFVAQGESGLVCLLKKSIYGLRQSPRDWSGCFSTSLYQFGLTRCSVDHSVFYKHSIHGSIFLVVYVDDIIITGNDEKGICDLKTYLNDQFQTKDLGKLKYFLGIEVARSARGMCLMQRKYTLNLLKDAGMLGCKPVENPMDPNTKLMKDEDAGPLYIDTGRYRRLVGKLNYLTITRPDIAFPVSVVSQFMATPRVTHMEAVIRILRYLKGTPGVGLVYTPNGHTNVEGYSDADWAGSPFDRRSTTGYCVFVGGNLVSWKSKKQHTVARSSAESEYRAMAQTTCELVWLKELLIELKQDVKGPMQLLCDNVASMHIASNPVFHERTKHIEVDCHYVREKIQDGTIVTKFVNTNNQLADIFTKSLPGIKIRRIRCKLGSSDVSLPMLQLEGEC